VEVGPDVEGEMFKEFAEKMFGKGVMTKPSARR
jgi:hypothetical protein